MPGADDSGALADADIIADILREAGGAPDAPTTEGADADGEAAEASPQTPARTPPEAADSDDSADDEGTEPAESASDATANEETDPAAAPAEEADAAAPAAAPEPTTAPAAADADETPEWARKRFSEYARKVEALERELQAARAAPAAPPPPATGEVALLTAESPEALAALRRRAEELEEWAELNQQGTEPDPARPDAPGYSPQQVAQVKVAAKRRLRDLEERAREIEHVRNFSAHAVAQYPELAEADSEAARAAAFVLQRVPELRRLPNYKLILGDALAGERARLSKLRAAQQAPKVAPDGKPLAGQPIAPAKGAAPRAVPPVVRGAPVRAAAATPGKQANLLRTRQRALSTGSEADLADLVEASLG